MKLRAVIMMAIVLAGFAAPAYAVNENVRKKNLKPDLAPILEAAWSKSRKVGVTRAIKEAGGLETYDNLKGTATWAEKRYSAAYNRDPWIGLLLSEALAGLGTQYDQSRHEEMGKKLMDQGAAAFLSSQVIAFENVARCADKSAGGSYITQWTNGKTHRFYKSYLSKQTENDRDLIWTAAMKQANERDTMRPDRDVCTSGADAVARAQMDKACEKIDECDLSKYVELIKDDVWQTRREQVQAMIKTRIEEGKL